jgi:hypothetical protein
MIDDNVKMEIIAHCGELAELWVLQPGGEPDREFCAAAQNLIEGLEDIAGELGYHGPGHRLTGRRKRMVEGGGHLTYISAVTHMVRCLSWRASQIYAAIMGGCAELKFQLGLDDLKESDRCVRCNGKMGQDEGWRICHECFWREERE